MFYFVALLAAFIFAPMCSVAQEALPKPVRVAPVLGSVVPAKYPLESKAAKEEGTVKLRVIVDAAGWTTSARVLESSGYPRLDDAALEAVRHWRYRPATVDGVPTATPLNVPIRFVLKEK